MESGEIATATICAQMFHLDPNKIRREYLSAEQFMDCCGQVWSTDRRSTRAVIRRAPLHGSIVYAKRDHTGSLFPVLGKRRAKVVLVTAESDKEVTPDEAIPPQVGAWFSTNTNNPRVHPLPLGLGNSYCKLTVKAPELAEVHGSSKAGLLYVNFRVTSNEAERRPVWDSYQEGERQGWVTRQPGDVGGLDYARELARHEFVICPPGNGTDTHRLWEALYTGSVPVVQRSRKLEFFEDLPILFVEHLEGLSREFLREQARRMASREDWNWPKLFVPWWRERFEHARAALGSRVPWNVFLRSKAALFCGRPLRG